jgi:hypothetical protein
MPLEKRGKNVWKKIDNGGGKAVYFVSVLEMG